MPPKTLYHRWLGWHAVALRRAVIVASIGLIVAVVLLWFVTWEMAVLAGLLGAGFALSLAERESGPPRVLLTGFAVLTVALSWTVVNTVSTLRDADLHFRSRAVGIAFGDAAGQERPT